MSTPPRMDRDDYIELAQAAEELRQASSDSLAAEYQWDWDMDAVRERLHNAYTRMENALKAYEAVWEKYRKSEEASPKKFRSTLISGPYQGVTINLNREPRYILVAGHRYDLIVDPDTDESLGVYAYIAERNER